MSSPTVTATVSVHDEASQRLRAIADLLHKLARDFDKAGQGNNLARHFDAANRAAERHLTLLHKMRDAFKGIALGAASYAAYKFPHMAMESIEDYRPIEREMIAMKVAKHIGDADYQAMWAQHLDLAKRFGVKPEEVVHAQSAFALRDYSPQVSMAMAEQAAKLSKALGTTGDKAAAMLEGALFGTGQHIGNVDEAKRVSQRFGDMMTIMAKRGAMNAEDIEGFWKYAAAATTTAKISPEQSAAIAMILKRENIRGDDSGNMLKQLSAHMLRPTAEGHISLQAAGIRFEDYLAKTTKLSAANLNLALTENIGKTLSDAAVARIQTMIDAGAIANRRDFAKAAVAAWEAEGPKTAGKGAKAHVPVMDLNKIAKQASRVFDSSQGDLNGERLLDDMLAKMSKQQAMAFFGAKQGSKLAAVIMQLQTELQNKDYLKNSQGEMERVAGERMTGVDAAASRYEATMEATRNDWVRANAGAIEKIADIGAKAADYASTLSDSAKQIASVGATALSAVGNLANLGVSALIVQKLLSGGAGAGAAEGAAAGAGAIGRVVQGAGAAGGAMASAAAGAGAAEASAGAAIKGALKGGLTGALVGLAWEKRYDIEEKLTGRDAKLSRDLVEAVNARFHPAHSGPSFKDAFARFRPSPAFTELAHEDRGRARPFAESSLPQSMKYFGHDTGPVHVDTNVSVQGTVTGEAQLMNRIIVEPSPLLIAIVHEAQQAKITLQGAINDLGRSTPANSGVMQRPMTRASLGLGSSGFGFGVAGTK